MVAAGSRPVTVLGECRWTARLMRRAVLDDLLDGKAPALAQAGVDVTGGPVVLFSRSGFAPDLREAAAVRGARLVELDVKLGPEPPAGRSVFT